MSKETEENVEDLSAIFKNGLDLFNNLGTTDEPTNSYEIQSSIKRAMGLFETATKLVSLAGMFSHNETLEELPTSNVQYLLLPALLGSLSLKLCSGNRREIVNCAEIYFQDFLQRCNEYGLSDYNFKEKSNADQLQGEMTNSDQLKHMVATRANKIQRYKDQKELESKLASLKISMTADESDEENKRDYYINMVKLYIYQAIDDLDCIRMEKPILAHMEALKAAETIAVPKRPTVPLKPIIIARDEEQKKVFGLGYSSIPTMTVQEFYDKRVQDGIFPGPCMPQKPITLQDAATAGTSIEQEDIETEEKVEADDDENLQRMRAKDEFKDDHRRGWGNRMNRS